MGGIESIEDGIMSTERALFHAMCSLNPSHFHKVSCPRGVMHMCATLVIVRTEARRADGWDWLSLTSSEDVPSDALGRPLYLGTYIIPSILILARTLIIFSAFKVFRSHYKCDCARRGDTVPEDFWDYLG